jgi:hypothetical protein
LFYTDDSSICSAAVHAGKITVAAGGVVEITIQGGLGSYPATTRNGVASDSYGNWPGSYSFGAVSATPINATATASALRGRTNEVVAYTCPANVALNSIWGTDFYTDDSAICSAAIHAGAIGRTQGGLVLMAVRSGRNSYGASTRNGVTSRAYGSWVGSLSFR